MWCGRKDEEDVAGPDHPGCEEHLQHGKLWAEFLEARGGPDTWPTSFRFTSVTDTSKRKAAGYRWSPTQVGARPNPVERNIRWHFTHRHRGAELHQHRGVDGSRRGLKVNLEERTWTTSARIAEKKILRFSSALTESETERRLGGVAVTVGNIADVMTEGTMEMLNGLMKAKDLEERARQAWEKKEGPRD